MITKTAAVAALTAELVEVNDSYLDGRITEGAWRSALAEIDARAQRHYGLTLADLY